MYDIEGASEIVISLNLNLEFIVVIMRADRSQERQGADEERTPHMWLVPALRHISRPQLEIVRDEVKYWDDTRTRPDALNVHGTLAHSY